MNNIFLKVWNCAVFHFVGGMPPSRHICIPSGSIVQFSYSWISELVDPFNQRNEWTEKKLFFFKKIFFFLKKNNVAGVAADENSAGEGRDES